MPRTVITPREVTLAGVTLSAVAVDSANGMQFQNVGNETMFVLQATSTQITVTFDVPAKVKGLTITDVVVVVAVSTTLYIGPFPSELFNQADGAVYVDFSVSTGATCQALHMARL